MGARPRFPWLLRVVGYQRSTGPATPASDPAPRDPDARGSAPMSLWTPGGEQPVDRGDEPADARPPAPTPEPAHPEQEAEAHEIAAEMAAGPRPAGQVPGRRGGGQPRHGLLRAGRHPPVGPAAQASRRPSSPSTPSAPSSRSLKGRLGADEATLQDALAQLRLAFVQMKASYEGRRPRPPAPPTPPRTRRRLTARAQARRRRATASRPVGPGSVEGHRGAHGDGARAVGDAGAVERPGLVAVVGGHGAGAHVVVERADPAGARCRRPAGEAERGVPVTVSGRSWPAGAR